MDACVRGLAHASPARARWHPTAFEFHCGNPPPAAAPRTRTRTGQLPQLTAPPIRRGARLPQLGAGVRVDLGTERNLDDLWGFPCHATFLHDFVSTRLRHYRSTGVRSRRV